MAKLNAKKRNALPSKDFAGKGRSYPIEDAGHAKAAIARAKEFHPADEATIVRKAEAKLGRKPNNPHGNPGHHSSTDGYEHSGSTHTSEDR